MIFSTDITVSPTFARLCCMPITVAVVALRQVAFLNEELTVLELPIMKQALLHQSVSFPRGPHIEE